MRLAHVCARRAHACRRSVGSREGAGRTGTAWRGTGRTGTAWRSAGLRAWLCRTQMWPVRLCFGWEGQATRSCLGGSQPQGAEQGLPPQPHAWVCVQHPAPRSPWWGRLVLPLSRLLGSPVPSTSWGWGRQGRDGTGKHRGTGVLPVYTSNTEHTDHTLLIHPVPTHPLYLYSARVHAGAHIYVHHPPTLVHHLDAQMCADVV